jgi:4-amino-4-deoxy-L-arabinose transferase-like glycosyltransferase
MLTGPHALMFASFDPAGFVSVDKPPLGLWLQAASAALFGFSGPALILPSAVSLAPGGVEGCGGIGIGADLHGDLADPRVA